VLTRNGKRLRVVHHGVLSDCVRDAVEVIVTGRLGYDDGWYLDGTAAVGKCPSKYEGGCGTCCSNKTVFK
jgi:hypothetical protein